MVDGDHASLRRIQRARLTRSMNRNMLTRARGFVDGGLEFGFRVLVNRGKMVIANYIWPSLINLDEIRAFFELFADRAHQFSGIIRISGIRQHVLCWVEVVGVFVSSENVDSVTANA